VNRIAELRPDKAEPGRNPGMALDLDWVEETRVNRSAVERRAASLPGRRTVKKDWQAGGSAPRHAIRCAVKSWKRWGSAI
jgi:hypothetical protein